MNTQTDFQNWFKTLWGHHPFPWQRMLAERLAEGPGRSTCPLPPARRPASVSQAMHWPRSPTWERTAPRRIRFVVDARVAVDETLGCAA